MNDTGEDVRDTKQVIVIRRDLKMRRGKEVAQGAHAAMQFVLAAIRFHDVWKTDAIRFTAAEVEWLGGSTRKVCVRCNSLDELLGLHEKAIGSGVKSFLINDCGLTEFHGLITPTCLAIGPDYDDRIDPITGELELM